MPCGYKHDIGCELALIHAPVIALSESFIDSVKEWVDGLGEGIELAAQFGGVKLVGQFLGFCHIRDVGEGIVIAFIRNAVLFENGLHQFPAVYVDLDIEREPCLDFDKHESEVLILVIEIIVKALGAA